MSIGIYEQEPIENTNKFSSSISDVTEIDLLQQLTQIQDDIEKEDSNIAMEYDKLRRLDYDSQVSSRRSSIHGSQGSSRRSSGYSSQGNSRRPSYYSDVQFEELEIENNLQEQLLQESDFFTKALSIINDYPSLIADTLSTNSQR